MIAQFDSECPICDGAIFAGRDEIARDAQGRWVHANVALCGPYDPTAADTAPEVGKPVCKVCRCQMPCWCDDGGHPEDAADRAIARSKVAAARCPGCGRASCRNKRLECGGPFDGFL